jgi:hypothetical protein
MIVDDESCYHGECEVVEAARVSTCLEIAMFATMYDDMPGVLYLLQARCHSCQPLGKFRGRRVAPAVSWQEGCVGGDMGGCHYCSWSCLL